MFFLFFLVIGLIPVNKTLDTHTTLQTL